MIASWRGFYAVLLIAAVTVLLFYALGTRPLIRQEREVERQLAEERQLLREEGLGTTTSEVRAGIENVQEEIDRLSKIAADPSRGIQFDPEVEAMLERQFAVLDFEERRYLVADRIEALARQTGVELFDALEEELPAYRASMERPYLLWAQLAVIEQVVSSAIREGISSVDTVQLIERAEEENMGLAETDFRHRIPVRIALTGEMEAVRDFLFSLPLNDDELREIGNGMAPEGEKSAFDVGRFVLRKSSRERANEVKLELVASGFLDLRRVR